MFASFVVMTSDPILSRLGLDVATPPPLFGRQPWVPTAPPRDHPAFHSRTDAPPL